MTEIYLNDERNVIMNIVRPFSTKIFLDSASLDEIQEAKEALGFLDGITTNPTLLGKVLDHETFTQAELVARYGEHVTAMYEILPDGDISMEVYSDESTSRDDMLSQAEKYLSMCPRVFVKFPTTTIGLDAATMWAKRGHNVNMTLVASVEQAYLVHTALSPYTTETQYHYLSPFIGRREDYSQDGEVFLRDIARLYKTLHSPIRILAASIRTWDQCAIALSYHVDVITAPSFVLLELASKKTGLIIPSQGLDPYSQEDLENIVLSAHIEHPVTKLGQQKFSEDWKKMLKGF